MEKYRDTLVCSDFRLTSQNPGEGHSVTEPAFRLGRHSKLVPQVRNSVIEDRIARHLRVGGMAAGQLFLDVQKFLWMAAQSPEPCIPAPLIDDAWHQFILYTREYEDFCKTYCGGFMHHQPHQGEAQPVDVSILRPTIDLMHKVFGGKPNSNWDYRPSLHAQAAAA